MYRLSFKPVVNDVIRGYNGTGLAYGQTGSGKSYTMFGSDNTPGLAHLALIDIFDSIGGKNRDALDSGNDNSPQKFSYIGSNNNSLNNSRHSSPIAARKGPIDTFSVNSGMDNASSIASPMMSTLGNDSNRLKAKVFIAFYQIYIEQVYDLLGPNSGTVEPLTIREDPKLGVYIENLTYTHIHDKEEAYNVITNGLRNRTVRSTKQNMKSSRSHAILQIFVDVETDSSTDGNHNMMNNNNDYIGNNNDLIDYTFRRSILTLVDLAGSERVKQVKTSTKHFKEAVQINKSISALGTCIQALAVMSADNETFSGFNMNLNVNNNIRSKASRHIPFRDSKLTRILAEPLGGNSKTCIITNISPCAFNYDETVSTLKFASR